MPISGPGKKIPGVDAGDNVVPVQFNKVKVGDKVVIVLRGSHGGRCVGSCAGIGGGKLNLGGSIYYTEDKKGRLKRNISKGDLDFEKEEIMLCWVVTPAAQPAQERVVARSKKRKVEVRVEEEDEDTHTHTHTHTSTPTPTHTHTHTHTPKHPPTKCCKVW